MYMRPLQSPPRHRTLIYWCFDFSQLTHHLLNDTIHVSYKAPVLWELELASHAELSLHPYAATLSWATPASVLVPCI